MNPRGGTELQVELLHKYADKKTGKLINNTNIVYLEYNGKHYPTLIKNVKKVIYDTNSKQTMPF